LDRRLDHTAQSGRRLLLEHEVYSWLEAAGLGTAPAHRLLGSTHDRNESSSEAHSDRSRASELTGERIVLKVSHPRILHKSEVHGVQIVPRQEMEARAEAMRREVPAHFAVRHGESLEGFERLPARILAVELVESVATPGAELLVGIRGTREFGPTLVLGWGGSQAEYMAGRIKTGRAICTVSPLLQSDQDIWERFGATVSCDALLGKLPGSTPATTEQTLRAWLARLAAVTRRFSSASDGARWWIEELEVNPVVFRDGRPVPLDGILRFQPSEPPRARPSAAAVRALLHPERIALVGVSTKGRNVARIILDNLRAAGTPTDRLAIVKPGAEEIDGVACFPSVAALPWTCDLLCISIAAASVPACIRESVEHRKAHAILLVTGGMGETTDGKAVEKEIGEILADARRRQGPDAPALLGGNSLGLQSRPASIDTLFIPESKLPRPDPAVSFGDDLAIASQSGAFLVSRESSLEGLAPRYAVSTGNQIDIGIADLVEAWSVDDA
ncbi:MAG: acetate--CoA ligase family protein, partial [Candidatus Eisenbacteria bacterium]|nr:acetate--CoA ligase family protein [Candidatus Eisenbacteria bacterium]